MNPSDPNPSIPTPDPAATGDRAVPLELWQALDALWKTILGIEANVDGARLNLNGVLSEMERAYRQSLTVEEKQHASQLDVGQWNSAKSRIHYAMPKVREFIHRATWAQAAPERKRLEEIVRSHVEPRLPFPDPDKVREEMEHLLKARQVLLAQGTAVSQVGRSAIAEAQRILATLRRNAADNARRKRDAKRR